MRPTTVSKPGKLVLTLAACAIAALASSASLADKKPPRGPDRDMFERVDSDGDGFISGTEHAAGVAIMTAKMNQRFADMDADNDGRVSKQEAKDHHRAMRDKRREQRDEHNDWRDRD